MYEIKRTPEDFAVEEITPEGKVLPIGTKRRKRIPGSGDQLICALEKNNWDTLFAVREIAERLHVSPKRIGFAGTKDKRALTAQRISLWKIRERDVENLRIKDIRIVPLRYSGKRVEMGDLWGNRFTIKVYTDGKPKRLKEVPNFFGEQRFGTLREITHLVGKEIINGDLEKAVKIYLGFSAPSEREETRLARERLSADWDCKEALSYFPPYLRHERTLLGHLSTHMNDYAGALRKLPRSLRLMFIHAYQAYLFNRFLERVVEKKLKYTEGPLYGYELKPKNALEKAILKEEGLEPKDFLIKSIPELSHKGMRRELFVPLKGFRMVRKGKDFITVRFSLPKGAYATSALRAIFGNA